MIPNMKNYYETSILKLYLHPLRYAGIPHCAHNTIPNRNNGRMKKRRLVSIHKPVSHHFSRFPTTLAFIHTPARQQIPN